MRAPLQTWYDAWLAEHRAGTDLIYANPKDPSLEQVHFVRDTLASLVWADTFYDDRPREPAPRTDRPETAWVIGEHHSKSVRLPVYSLERPDRGIRFVLRDNFYDWKLSVISVSPIQSDLFPFLFHTTPPVEPEYTGNELSSVYFEGFPDEFVFGYQALDPRSWSASLGQRALWTTIMLCMRSVGVVKPRTWHTRESHRAFLDAKTASWKRRWEREKATEAAAKNELAGEEGSVS